MVKKTTFLEKLRNRWRSTSVGVESADSGTASGDRIPSMPVQNPVTSVRGRKLSDREVGLVAVQEGFADLANLMRGLQTRMEVQGERMASVSENLGVLPTLGNAQLDTLREISERLKALDQVPESLTEMRAALDRASAMDERTTATLDEFKSNMERIQGAMNQMVDRATTQARDTASLAKAQREHIDGFTRTLEEQRAEQDTAVRTMVNRVGDATADGMQSLREAQADQSTRLGKLIEDGTRTNRGILVLLVGTLIGLIVLTAILIAR